MSTMYDQIRIAAKQKGVELSDTAVNRIVGTLRFAGTDALSAAITLEAERQAKEAATIAANTFGSIDASLKSGKCPRCGKMMKEVLLADASPAIYCSGECRIVLWKQNDEAE